MLALSLLLAAALMPKRPVQWADIPPGIRPLLAEASDEDSFQRLRRRIERDTQERLRQGEDEHLIYFLLQSMAFTKRPRVEPALSAREFAESATIPPAAQARMEEFLRALDRPTSGPRLAYFQQYLAPRRRSPAELEAAYRQAMRFLHEKEFAGSPAPYQRRGHSTDTGIEVNYTISTALAVIRALDPSARLERVLIAGPGLDFAPRTAFQESFPPQSYQPYLTADSLLRWQLADPRGLSVHCVDINPRVVGFIEEFPRRADLSLTLSRHAGEPDYEEYFADAGKHIGETTPVALGKIVRVRRELAARVRAEPLNILTERYDPPPGFDLVIATNLLLYFDSTELALALANLSAMLRAGGFLIHNELRPEVESIARALDMPPIQGRTLQVAPGTKRPLMDAFVIHRRVGR
ncbi:MAG: hypothetical protein HYR60_08610 [Acidobacteria bacterium]|nr:hypothetical protein [Acidobacteriota bacterium]